jgi:hypothetical protein
MMGGSRMGGPHFGGGGHFVEGFHRGHGRHFAGFGGDYYGYYDCGSPYALTNPYVCQYPYGY